jgi:hypothetical protein
VQQGRVYKNFSGANEEKRQDHGEARERRHVDAGWGAVRNMGCD